MRKNWTLSILLSVLLVTALALGLMAAGCGEKDEEVEVTSTESSQDASNPADEQTGGDEKALIVIANQDFNDTEYGTTRTVLEENGIAVDIANTSGQASTGIDDTSVRPDMAVSAVDVADYQAVVFIGGPGAGEYFDEKQVLDLAKQAADSDKVIAAICVAPVILANAGLLGGKQATVYSGEKDKLTARGCEYTGTSCAVAGKIITANGPDAAREFAEKIVEALQ